MASQNDYYKILGVSKGNSKETIKKAYKKLAMKYHPDRVSDNKKEEYEKKFKEISEAYTVLGDDKKKQQYDSYGHESFNQGAHQQQGNPFQGEDTSSMFRDIFENNFFGGSRRGHQRQNRGEDLQYEMPIDFKEAALGCEKEIQIQKNVPCEKCEGTGAEDKDLDKCTECNGTGSTTVDQRTPFGILRQEVICKKCKGEGSIPKRVCKKCEGRGLSNKKIKIKINIPEGIDDEQVLRVPNEGGAIKGGQNGDLLLIIRVRPHKTFKRDRGDIYMELPITFSQAALGCKIDVPTLTSDTKIKIAPGTESGTILRLKNKGIKNVNSFRTGDQFINIKIKTPKKLSGKQKDLFKELSKLE